MPYILVKYNMLNVFHNKTLEIIKEDSESKMRQLLSLLCQSRDKMYYILFLHYYIKLKTELIDISVILKAS